MSATNTSPLGTPETKKNKRKRRRTLNLLCISRTRIVRVNLLRRRALVEAHEAVQEVVARGVVVVAPGVVGEVVPERAAREFLGEEVDLVQEQDLWRRGRVSELFEEKCRGEKGVRGVKGKPSRRPGAMAAGRESLKALEVNWSAEGGGRQGEERSRRQGGNREWDSRSTS